MLDYKVSKEDELRTAHFTENSTNDEIKDVMTKLNMQSLGTMYYDVKSTNDMYNAMNTQGILLQLVNHDEDGNPMVDDNGFLFSGKYDMYDEYGTSGGNIDLSEVITRLESLRDNVKEFVSENEKDAMLVNRRLPESSVINKNSDVEKEL